MRFHPIHGWTYGLLLWCSMTAAHAVEPEHACDLLTFGPTFALTTVTAKACEVANGGSADAPALRLTTAINGSWPGATLAAPGGKWDLSTYEYLSLDVRNIDSHDIDVFVRVDNPGADGHSHCMTERIGTQPDQRVTITIAIKRVTESKIKLFGMNGFPQGLHASGGIDPSNIIALTIFTEDHSRVSNTFEISRIRAFGTYHDPAWITMDEAQFFPFIDRFGQFVHQEWPGKIHNENELVANRTAEALALAGSPGPHGWDTWGGWIDGPQLPASGYFRTAKHDGRWWLVDPDGRLFFSTGLTCVGGGWATTPITDREQWFAGLPTKTDDPFLRFKSAHEQSWGGGYYAGKSPAVFNFSDANLQRKYGPDWATIYPGIVHQRLRAWGINTLGNWSSPAYCALRRTPYTRTFWYDSPHLGKSNFPDVFAPTFTSALDQGAKKFLGDSIDDPWCIGYFVDNEMSWGGDTELGQRTLNAPATQAAKRTLAEWLQKRHPTIADLNAAWGTTWESWDAFNQDTKTRPSTTGANADLAEFTGLIAETYFRSVHEAIQRIAPHKLYLGCRSVGGARAMAEAAAKHCDVVSYNRYCASVRDVTLPGNLDAPIIIGEFHFGGLDRGLFWSGLFSADNQLDRARKFTTYVGSALDNPLVVGVHWFQYGDEATTGRIDGENAQCGFVDVCDTPYAETTGAARANAETMYSRRAHGK